jgi:hypothetical protein
MQHQHLCVIQGEPKNISLFSNHPTPKPYEREGVGEGAGLDSFCPTLSRISKSKTIIVKAITDRTVKNTVTIRSNTTVSLVS